MKSIIAYVLTSAGTLIAKVLLKLSTAVVEVFKYLNYSKHVE